MSIETRYLRLREEVDQACVACGRDPREVVLLAVSKTVGVPEIEEARAAGSHDFGENRPEILAEKAAILAQETWHFIGNIQSRKISGIVRYSSLIHSLFQKSHIEKVDAAAYEQGKIQKILLEVNVSGEKSKSGLAPYMVEDMLRFCGQFSHIEVCGLMTMAPRGNEDEVNACFSALAQLRENLERDVCSALSNCSLHELSMGMSEDWRYAIPKGATIVRIGRAIFDDAFE